MKIYNYGNDYVLAARLNKEVNADNQVKEAAEGTVEHSETTQDTKAPKETHKTGKKKK